MENNFPVHGKLEIVGDADLQLKLLNRFRKIFLSKQRFWDVKKTGKVSDEIKQSLGDLLTAKGTIKRKIEFDGAIDVNYPNPHNVSGEIDGNSSEETSTDFTDDVKAAWFDLVDRESFRAEIDQLIRILSLKEASNLKDDIAKFEKNFSGAKEGKEKYLYYTRHTEGILNARKYEKSKYSSLQRIIRQNFQRLGGVDTKSAVGQLRKFIQDHFGENKDKKEDFIFNGLLWLDSKAEPYEFGNITEFIVETSDEYKRIILNAFFSEIIGVEPSEEVPFVKRSGGGIDYAAFRILVWLRNKRFCFNDFTYFLSKLNPVELPERMMVDLGLGGVVKTFIRNVKDPKKVDDLIRTHRIVKGLWQNGSKFLNSYTLHNEEHAITLIKQSMEIIRRIDYLQLKQLDYYILFLACYLHDISMVIHPDLQKYCHATADNIVRIEPFLDEMEGLLKQRDFALQSRYEPKELINFWKEAGGEMVKIFKEVFSYFEEDVRNPHAEESAKFIIEKRKELFEYLEETILSAVARAGREHAYAPHEIYSLASEARKEPVSGKYISIILRLADLMDVSNDRVNYHLLKTNVEHLSPISRFHWISHLITDEIKLVPHYSLETRTISDCEVKGADRPSLKPEDFFIKETLRFYFILNVKSLEPIKNVHTGCRGWCRRNYDNSNVPERYKEYDGITIKFEDKNCDAIQPGKEENSTLNICERKGKEEGCTMVCLWMVKKHDWMFKELAELKRYLNSTNHKPFVTDIEVNILYKNVFEIEPSLFDNVERYLKAECDE